MATIPEIWNPPELAQQQQQDFQVDGVPELYDAHFPAGQGLCHSLNA